MKLKLIRGVTFSLEKKTGSEQTSG